MLAAFVCYGEPPFKLGSGLRLAPRAVSPWGGPAARLLGLASSPRPLRERGRGRGGAIRMPFTRKAGEGRPGGETAGGSDFKSRRWWDGVCLDTTARLCNYGGLMYVGLSGLALLVLTTFHLTPPPFPN